MWGSVRGAGRYPAGSAGSPSTRRHTLDSPTNTGQSSAMKSAGSVLDEAYQCSPEEWSSAWNDELSRRIAQIESGEAELVDGADVIADLRDALSAQGHRGSTNVFEDLGFAREEAAQLELRADLMIELNQFIRDRALTLPAAAALLDVSQSQVDAIINGKIGLLDLDVLVAMLRRAGLDVALPRADGSRSRERTALRADRKMNASLAARRHDLPNRPVDLRHLVPRPPVEEPSRLRLHHPAPLFEEEGHARASALVPD